MNIDMNKKEKRSTLSSSSSGYAFSSFVSSLPKQQQQQQRRRRRIRKSHKTDEIVSYQERMINENESIDSNNNHQSHHHRNFYSAQQQQQQQQQYSKSAPGLYMLPIENVTATVGRTAILKCVTNHNGPSKPAWLKMDDNSTPTLLTLGTHTLMNEDEGKYRVTQNENHWYLHINRIQVIDRGLYMCQINAKTMLSQIGYLDVYEPPVINEELTSSDTIVDELSKVSLRCATIGYPMPSVTWRREDGKSLNLGQYGGKKIAEPKWQGEYLNITQIKRDDMGAYLCIANNGVQPAVIPPKIRVHKQLIGSYIGSDVELGCDVDASPKPETFWLNSDGHRLDKIMNGGDNNGDDDNDGSISSAATTTIEQLYNIRSKLNVQQNDHYVSYSSSSSYRLNDNNNRNGINRKKKYHFEEEQNGYRTTMKLIIRNLQMADYGSYKCSGQNSIGKKEGMIRLYVD
ncbi:hypothetical protein DERF_008502 [Dermatophagoides farinae]|uniref:Ig-like domain-containing protein n=1 Tax=Dermatophagoides farinae TaxID=6954 RepID=A0A922I031_DERFA|nr:hypothetical protein DERF_008502 [Dermatophagoides farinae]